MNLFSKQEKICRDLKDLHGLATSLGNQGTILRHYDNLKGALQRFNEQEKICRELKDAKSLAVSIANQALVLRQQGHVRRATKLANDALFITQAQGYLVLEKNIQAIVDEITQEGD